MACRRLMICRRPLQRGCVNSDSKSSTSRSHASMFNLNVNPYHLTHRSVRNQMTTQAWSRSRWFTGNPSQTFWATANTVPKVNPSSSRTETQIPLYFFRKPPVGCWTCNCAIVMRGSMNCMSSHVGRVMSDDVLGIASDALQYVKSAMILSSLTLPYPEALEIRVGLCATLTEYIGMYEGRCNVGGITLRCVAR
jgi:hypothetical protein